MGMLKPPLTDIYHDVESSSYNIVRCVCILMPNRYEPQYAGMRAWGDFVPISESDMEASGREIIMAELIEQPTRLPEHNPAGPEPRNHRQLLKEWKLTGLKHVRVLLDYPRSGHFCLCPSHVDDDDNYNYKESERIFVPCECSNADFFRCLRTAFKASTNNPEWMKSDLVPKGPR